MKVLGAEQCDAYGRDGFIAVPGLVDEGWLRRLRSVTAEIVEHSRTLTGSNLLFDLEPDHTAESPRLRRPPAASASTTAAPATARRRTDRSRSGPLLLQTYSAADAFPYTDIVRRSPHGDVLIRGRPARWARHDPRPCLVGPSQPRTIFEVQQRDR